MAQQDTNQLIQQDPTLQPQDPLAGAADTSSGTAGVQPVTTQTEPTPPPEPPAPQTQETEGVRTTTPTTFAPTFEVPGALSEITPEQTVAGQIEQITAKGSPLMQAAQTRAQQAAQQRGLGNSTLAIEAGQKALYEAALPIAQADAATAAGRANQLLQGYIQAGQSAQDATQQSQLLIQEAVNRGLLSQQEAGQAIEQIQVAGQIAQDQAVLDSQLQRDNAEYLARLQQELGQTDQAQQVFKDYSNAVQGIIGQRSNIITQIQSQPGLSATTKTALINQVNVQFQEDIANLGELYSTNPLWDADWQMIGTAEPIVAGSTQSTGALQTTASAGESPVLSPEQADALDSAMNTATQLSSLYKLPQMSTEGIGSTTGNRISATNTANTKYTELLQNYGAYVANRFADAFESQTGATLNR